MRHPLARHWRNVLLGLVAALAIGLAAAWKGATDRGGQRPAEPFRIAGNLYYVGANDVAAFLLTGPAGHVLLDGGYPGTAPLILASVARLGFDARDVKLLLNSEPHFDHAGGLAALQRATGAELWASEASARVIEAGGGDEAATFWPMRVVHAVGLSRYPAARVARRLADGDTVRLGPVALTAHVTPGHSRGCTSWSFPVREGGRTLRVVSACSLALLPGMAFVPPERYPGIRADFERSVRVLRGLDPDVWVTSHARLWGRYRKFRERAAAAAAGDPAAPFVDPAGYRAYVDSGEARFRRELAAQRRDGAPAWWQAGR